MRIAAEITPFDTLGHVAGVHYVAMHVARQLKMLGKPVDLMLMSAAAALHDIGKFGCRKEEAATPKGFICRSSVILQPIIQHGI